MHLQLILIRPNNYETNCFVSLPFTTSCWNWRRTCSTLALTWSPEGLLLLWCSADAVGSFCGSASEKLWDLWHSLSPLGLSSVNVSLLMKHWGGKKSASLDSLSVSREQSESLLCSREGEEEKEVKRRTRRREQNVAKKCSKWVILQLLPPYPPLGNGCSLPIGSWVQLLLNVSRQIDCVQLLQHFDRLQPHAARRHCGLWTFISAASRHSYNSRCFKCSDFFFSLLYGCHTNPSWYYSCKSAACPLLGESQEFQTTSWNPPVVPASEWVSEWGGEWMSRCPDS